MQGNNGSSLRVKANEWVSEWVSDLLSEWADIKQMVRREQALYVCGISMTIENTAPPPKTKKIKIPHNYKCSAPNNVSGEVSCEVTNIRGQNA